MSSEPSTSSGPDLTSLKPGLTASKAINCNQIFLKGTDRMGFYFVNSIFLVEIKHAVELSEEREVTLPALQAAELLFRCTG